MTQITKQQILEFLSRNHIFNLATVSPEGKPNAAILLYIIDDQFNFYFSTHAESQKSLNLQNHPFLSASLYQLGYMGAQIEGEAEIIQEEALRQKIINKLAEKAVSKNFYPPLLRITGQNYVVFKIKPHIIKCLDLKNEHINEENSPFSILKFDQHE